MEDKQNPKKLPLAELNTAPEITERYRIRMRAALLIGIVFIVVATAWWIKLGQPKSTFSELPVPATILESTTPKVEPKLTASTIVEGFSNIWDVAFLSSNTLLFTVRSGEIWGYSLETKQQWLVSAPQNVLAAGEGGLLGMTLDSAFTDNRYVYVCYNATGSSRSVRVARFILSLDEKSVSDVVDIIPDIESQAGRHSGCRMAMKDDVLWVGTGDSAIRTAPQNPESLAGKVLRVDREGKPVNGNLGEPFDPRIYNYGHRNIQGLVLFDEPAANGALGFTAEHGSNKDDEINWLLPGNFGWDPSGGPNPGYDESIGMTDTTRFPDAVQAIWSSGKPTIAPGGVGLLTHSGWSAWQGRAVLAVLKDKHVRLIDFALDGTIRSEKEILADFGRIRTAIQGPDGFLYLTTDNGKGADKIIQVHPNTTQ